MKVKLLIIVNLILLSIIIFMGVHIYEDNQKMNGELEKMNTADQADHCLENPIDPQFAQALSNAYVMIQYRQIQQLYYDTWIAQYNDIMKKIRKKCIYDEDIADYNLFINEMEKGFDKLQPCILNEILDNYQISESPQKDSWGNGTQEILLLYRGTMYRNACMFFIPFLEKSEYTFPVKEVEESLSKITKGI